MLARHSTNTRRNSTSERSLSRGERSCMHWSLCRMGAGRGSIMKEAERTATCGHQVVRLWLYLSSGAFCTSSSSIFRNTAHIHPFQ
jgi:hypothetical protein